MIDVWHRARDIIFMHKTNTNIEMLIIRESYAAFLKVQAADKSEVDEKSKSKFKEIESEYNELIGEFGGVI